MTNPFENIYYRPSNTTQPAVSQLFIYGLFDYIEPSRSDFGTQLATFSEHYIHDTLMNNLWTSIVFDDPGDLRGNLVDSLVFTSGALSFPYVITRREEVPYSIFGTPKIGGSIFIGEVSDGLQDEVSRRMDNFYFPTNYSAYNTRSLVIPNYHINETKFLVGRYNTNPAITGVNGGTLPDVEWQFSTIPEFQIQTKLVPTYGLVGLPNVIGVIGSGWSFSTKIGTLGLGFDNYKYIASQYPIDWYLNDFGPSGQYTIKGNSTLDDPYCIQEFDAGQINTSSGTALLRTKYLGDTLYHGQAPYWEVNMNAVYYKNDTAFYKKILEYYRDFWENPITVQSKPVLNDLYLEALDDARVSVGFDAATEQPGAGLLTGVSFTPNFYHDVCVGSFPLGDINNITGMRIPNLEKELHCIMSDLAEQNEDWVDIEEEIPENGFIDFYATSRDDKPLNNRYLPDLNMAMQVQRPYFLDYFVKKTFTDGEVRLFGYPSDDWEVKSTTISDLDVFSLNINYAASSTVLAENRPKLYIKARPFFVQFQESTNQYTDAVVVRNLIFVPVLSYNDEIQALLYPVESSSYYNHITWPYNNRENPNDAIPTPLLPSTPDGYYVIDFPLASSFNSSMEINIKLNWESFLWNDGLGGIGGYGDNDWDGGLFQVYSNGSRPSSLPSFEYEFDVFIKIGNQTFLPQEITEDLSKDYWAASEVGGYEVPYIVPGKWF